VASGHFTSAKAVPRISHHQRCIRIPRTGPSPPRARWVKSPIPPDLAAELVAPTKPLGLASAHLLITTLHWQGAHLGLVSPQRDYAVLPFAYCHDLLADATRGNSSVLLFNLLVAVT
jgi:hypothetical protein